MRVCNRYEEPSPKVIGFSLSKSHISISSCIVSWELSDSDNSKGVLLAFNLN
jgi:hypothetical protein